MRVTQSFSVKALWFKEWRQQRGYLLLGTLLMSLVPLTEILSWMDNRTVNLRISVENVGLSMSGFGLLVPIFAVGLSLASLQETYRDEGIQFAGEPVPRWAMLRTKFLMGTLILIAAQTFTVSWYDVATIAYGQPGSPIAFLAYWFTLIVWSLCFYSLSFVLIFSIRPIVLGILSSLVLLVGPLYVAQWFESLWIHHNADGSFYYDWSDWGLGVYNTIRNVSPYGLIHWSSAAISKSAEKYFLYGALPLVWVLGAYILLHFVVRRQPVDFFANNTRYTWVRALLRLLMTLAVAVILQRYVLQSFNEQPTLIKLVQMLILWACCHFMLRAILSQVDKRRGSKKRSLLLGKGE